jgi:hypothetical protein
VAQSFKENEVGYKMAARLEGRRHLSDAIYLTPLI